MQSQHRSMQTHPHATAPTRDSVTTILSDGSRPFIYPSDTRGTFTTARRIVAYTLIVFYLSLPWIKINGYPAVFLDIALRRFHLFGLTFAAQDMWLLFFVITGLGFTLFFITALLGRVWCGWACPQTIYLEHIYRRIEVLVEGDSLKRRALDEAPWNAEKISKRVIKHGLFFITSLILTHLFLAYFVSIREVWKMITSAPTEHWGTFVFIMAYTGLTYFIFCWFREQICIVICPYGRLQSVLTDDDTITIGYDSLRGERRGKAGAPGAGDCISCNRCVSVCPTGIDIRQGLQLECVGCTACIDACDNVMDRLKRSRGLIRYASQNKLLRKPTRFLRPRVILYGFFLVIGASVASWAISTLKPANLGVTRMVGAPYIMDAHTIRNQYLVRIVNKRNTSTQFLVHIKNAPEGLVQSGLTTSLEIPALSEVAAPLILQQTDTTYKGAFLFTVELEDSTHSFLLKRATEFLGPDPQFNLK